MFESPIVIIGAGPAGLMAAEYLASNGHEVHIYEQNKAAARKFLVAGHGGFNLTHNEPVEDFILRYDKRTLDEIIKNFDNKSTINWLHSLGIETYVGSSGKIFPIKNIKPIQVLKSWLDRLNALQVKIHYDYKFDDFDDDFVYLTHQSQKLKVPYAKLILALGGGSWSKTGSDGNWINTLEQKGIKIKALEAANSGYNTHKNYQELEGQNLKNIEVSYKNIVKKGEIVFTKYGIEGSPLYYLNRYTRGSEFPIYISIDLKPSLSIESIRKELSQAKNISKSLKEKLKLNNTAISLLKTLDKKDFTSAETLSAHIKNFKIEVTSLRPIDEVISTAGGICFSELNQDLALHKYPNTYCIGEMIDWEAPTGGYLLQACFSMGIWVGQYINNNKPI